MKRTLIIVVVFMTLCFSKIYAQPYMFEKPIHIDPESIEEIAIPNPSLLLFYGDFLNALALGNYTYATGIIKILSNIGGDKEIIDLIFKINSLANKTILLLNETEASINSAENLIIKGDMDAARDRAINAKRTLIEANQTLIKMKRYLGELSTRLKVFIGILSVQFNRLDFKFNVLDIRCKNLFIRLYSIRVLKPLLSLNVYPKKIIAGERIVVNGTLRLENGTILPNKEIYVRIGKKMFFKTFTDNKGYYFIEKNITIYERQVEISVTYLPKHDEPYASSYNSTFIYLSFIKTRCNVFLNKYMLTPGCLVNISIFVSPVDGGRNITIAFDGINYTNIVMYKPKYNVSFTIPLNTPPGIHLFEVFVDPHGRYSGVVSRVSIAIVFLPLAVHLDVPRVVLYPLIENKICGKILCNGSPLRDVNILIYRNDKLVASGKTDTEGMFSINLKHFWAPFMESKYRIFIKPSNPQFSSYEFETRVEEVNIAVFILIVFIISFSLKSNIVPYIFYRFERVLIVSSKISTKVGEIGGRLFERTRSIEHYISRRLRHAGGRRSIGVELRYREKVSRVYQIYLSIIAVFSKIFYPIRLSETFREYLKRLSPRLSMKILYYLVRITGLAEADRYGGKRVDESTVKTLAKNIVKEVEHEGQH